MQIFFHAKGVELEDADMEYMKERLGKLQKKFFSESVQFFVNVEKTRGDLHGDDLYEISIRAEDGPEHYFAEDRRDSITNTFDVAYDDLARVVRKERGKSRAILKRAGRKIKQLLRMKK